LEFRARLYHAAAHDKGVGIEGVDHQVKEQSQRPRLGGFCNKFDPGSMSGLPNTHPETFQLLSRARSFV
jgi:hypothetical protein